MISPLSLDLEDILEFHSSQLALYGGRDGIRDQGLLESALAQPSATMFGSFLHEDIAAMAVAYLYHIAENQPFIDGNKRTALMAALTFLKVNGYVLGVEQMELAEVALKIGRREMSKNDVTVYFRANLRAF